MFKIKSVSIGRLLSVFIAIMFLVAIFPLWLSKRGFINLNIDIAMGLFFFGTISALMFFILYNENSTIEINKNGYLIINDLVIPWEQLLSYKIDTDSSLFTKLILKTSKGRVLSIGHRNWIRKDDFEAFLLAFQENVQAINASSTDHRIIVIPSFLDTKKGKIMGYVAIFIWVAFTIIVFSKDYDSGSIRNFLMVTGFTLAIVGRIFLHKSRK